MDLCERDRVRISSPIHASEVRTTGEIVCVLAMPQVEWQGAMHTFR